MLMVCDTGGTFTDLIVEDGSAVELAIFCKGQ